MVLGRAQLSLGSASLLGLPSGPGEPKLKLLKLKNVLKLKKSILFLLCLGRLFCTDTFLGVTVCLALAMTLVARAWATAKPNCDMSPVAKFVLARRPCHDSMSNLARVFY